MKEVDKGSARPGEPIIHTVRYRNDGNQDITNLAIRDATPAYTAVAEATCGTLPAGLTKCAVAIKPARGTTGTLEWRFKGHLPPQGQGSMTFKVVVE